MKWHIPAKTFLVGEYAALAEQSAILLTTAPFFEISLIDEDKLVGIHPSSPCGIWWQKNKEEGKGLLWEDPYQGIGGLGASSAQFIGGYLATCYLKKEAPNLKALLETYYQYAWTGKGIRPSGYDIIAQSQQGVVYISKQTNLLQTYLWPFSDLSFFLIHTGVKLATHEHLQNTVLPEKVDILSSLVEQAKQAFEHKNSQQLITSISHYHEQLSELNLVAPHSLKLLNTLKTLPEVITAKGCGALGADILLIITARKNASAFKAQLAQRNLPILGTENNVTDFNTPLFLNNVYF